MEKEYYNFRDHGFETEETIVKFKEFYFCKSEGRYIECVGDSYYIINLNRLKKILVIDNEDIVLIDGLWGKFFK
jgi:hypothetical protein